MYGYALVQVVAMVGLLIRKPTGGKWIASLIAAVTTNLAVFITLVLTALTLLAGAALG